MEKGKKVGRWIARVAYFHGFIPSFLSWNAIYYFFRVEVRFIPKIWCTNAVYRLFNFFSDGS
jgi:hypothetical protein